MQIELRFDVWWLEEKGKNGFFLSEYEKIAVIGKGADITRITVAHMT